MKALTFSSFGSADVLNYTEVANPLLKNNEILIQTKAIGLNYADIMRRRGTYPTRGSTPYINGYEAAGIVVDNNGHIDFKKGDRVGFADVPFSNAELVAVPITHAIPLPDSIRFELAASVLLQGLSAHFLTTDCHETQKGETVLIHAAAGGVGQIMIQMCKLMGAKVFALVSSEGKKEITLQLGADETFLYSETWKEKVLDRIPSGVDAVFDSVGSTMEDSLKVTKVRGQVVFFGLANGEFNLGNPLYIIGTSKTITGGDLWDYLTSKEERVRRAQQLFDWITSGQIKISKPNIFRLADGKKAHEYMESRNSTGKILLVP